MKKLKKLFKKQGFTSEILNSKFGILNGKGKRGFTLVELIIVIAIIAVLAVAAFMMLTKWLGKSRDSRRIADIGTIKKALEISYSDTDTGINMYPTPSKYDMVVDPDTNEMWYLGVFGIETIENMDNMQKTPEDPSYNTNYKYALTLKQNKFQVGTILENGNELSLFPEVIAAGNEAYVDGNYNGYVSYPITGGTMILKTPSLLLYSGTTIETLTGDNSNLMVTGKSEGSTISLRNIETDENTTATEVAEALGIDENQAEIVLEREVGVNKESSEGITCDTNYSWNGTSCEPDTKTVSCGLEIPTYATATTEDTYVQTWNGINWGESYDWGINQDYCDFNCNSGYMWNSVDSCIYSAPNKCTSLGFTNAVSLSASPATIGNYIDDSGISFCAKYGNYYLKSTTKSSVLLFDPDNTYIITPSKSTWSLITQWESAGDVVNSYGDWTNNVRGGSYCYSLGYAIGLGTSQNFGNGLAYCSATGIGNYITKIASLDAIYY